MASRSDGAKAWSQVLSELAEVEVTVEWESPAWIVRWRDGPTRQVLLDRAAALGRWVGAPLGFDRLRFARTNTGTALALAWLTVGSPSSPTEVGRGVVGVEEICADTGYLRNRFDDPVIAAAELLAKLGHGDAMEMGSLLAQAFPPVQAHPMNPDIGPELRGRVTSMSWPGKGPAADLLGHPVTKPGGVTKPAAEDSTTNCLRCGGPIASTTGPGHAGRPAKYCSGACRTASHRERRRLGA